MGLFKRSAPRGATVDGVITGVRLSLNDDLTRRDFAVTLSGAAGPTRIGVRVFPTNGSYLRLGAPVVVALDDDRGVLDWDASCARWGSDDVLLTQESLRRAPDDGIEDSSIDMFVQRRLKKWTPTRATITSIERIRLMGMPTLNWDITLRLADGRTALSKRDGVPSYAHWFATPGAEVAAVIDPDDPGAANIDWRAVALEHPAYGPIDAAPAPGSVAELIADDRRQRAGASAVSVDTPMASLASSGPSASVDPSAPVVLDATLRAWVDARRGGHMKDKAFDKALSDWHAAGMCSIEQVDAARRAALS